MRLLLSQREPEGLERLFEAARELRARYFQDRVFLYGFTLFSTHCRNNCAFCHYRASNRRLERYRKSREETLQAAATLARSGVHLIDLTMGEDPLFRPKDERGFKGLTGLVSDIKRSVGLPVMVSPGVLPARALNELARAGADWYACYQETHSPELFGRLRVGQDYHKRMAAKLAAKQAGLLIEEGVLCGVGETRADLARSIACMGSLQADQVRVMTFVPQANTPLSLGRPPEELHELVTLAVMRLALPGCLIPATLDVGGLDGLKARLMAGANVVTSLVPPGQGWSGVAQDSLDIDEARRTPQAVSGVLAQCGLQTASQDEYEAWLHRRRSQNRDLQPARLSAP